MVVVALMAALATRTEAVDMTADCSAAAASADAVALRELEGAAVALRRAARPLLLSQQMSQEHWSRNLPQHGLGAGSPREPDPRRASPAPPS